MSMKNEKTELVSALSLLISGLAIFAGSYLGLIHLQTALVR